MDRAQDPENAVIFKQFEEACSDFQVPATRAAAEQILTQFRQIPKVLPACQYILEHTSSPMVQFQVALAIGDISVREYTLYDKNDLLRLKNYMIEFCIQREGLAKYVRDQLVLAVALITKRSLFEVSNEDRDAILLSVKQLLQMDADNAQVLALALANGLADQFSNTKSTTIGLTWEHHHNCKLFFENNILLPLFEMVITKLHELVSQVQHLPDNIPPILVEMLVLIEKILHWEFETTNATPVLPGTFAKEADLDEFDREDGPSSVKKTYVIFPKHWQPVIGSSEVLWLFFMTYRLVQDEDVLGHRCRQCLIQLAGFQQDFFNDSAEMIQSYATAMIHGIRKMISDVTAFGTSPDALGEQGPQMLGTIQMIRRLLENVSLANLCAIPDFFQFLNEVGMITVSCLGGTVTDVDEGWLSEACDECLQTWVKMVEVIQPSDPRGSDPKTGLTIDKVQHLTQYMTNVAYQIVDAYINTRLERSKMVLEDEEEEDEIDAGFKDWDTFGDQLTCIGILARLNPQPCLIRLQQLLSERFEAFKAFFTASNNGNEQDMILIHEQLHWIILIAAYILADTGKGEQPMIPESLLQLSGSQPYEQDQVVNLSQLFLELLRFSSSFSSNSVEASNCSPRVAETLIWFMERWSKSYLLLDENEYGYMSPNIARAFGRPGPSDGQGMQIIVFFIEQMKTNFILWNADPDVLYQLVQWLHSCGTSNNLKRGLLQSAHFPELVQFITQNLGQLPEVVHNSLVQTIATICSSAVDEETKSNYFGLMFKMIEDRLGSILHRPDFQQCYQQGEVVNNVINALEMFDGLALACQYNNTNIIVSFSSRFFESFVQLMNVYKTVPEVQLSILLLFSDLCNRLDFGLLSNEEKQMLYHTIIEIIKVYGATNQGKKRLHSQEEEEDKPYADISTILVMLSNIMSSGTEDFSRKGQGHSDVADVVLFGINIIIPMIDLEMLKIPSLCQQYIQLISHLIELFPDKLSGLPAPLFNNLMASLEYGIRHDIPDVNILTLQAIAPLTIWAYHQQLQGITIDFLKEAFQKFLQELLNCLLFQHLDTNIIDAASDALLALICIQRDVYMMLANQIISQQSMEIQSRLLNAFQKLDNATPPQGTPLNRNNSKFKEALLAFLMDVRAVLRVK
ncbi:MAG: armadillo-type protein [Benjaminiella poitrasii]|nr:MAG: armadillo-type protein [Benjaminiella poitrasii]